MLFTDSGTNLPGGGALAWGDYDKDGDLDLVLAARDGEEARTAVYRNDGGMFTRTDAVLQGVWSGAVDWGDYDNDDDLDLAVAGMTESGPASHIYQNNGGSFVDIHADLMGACFAGLAWGHADHDGQLDLAITGSNQARIYANAKGSFKDMKAGLAGVQLGSLAWGDCDGDGDFDLAIGGEYNTGWSIEPVTAIYQNQGSHRFAAMDSKLPTLSNAHMAWGDYDNDGDTDLALSGFTADGAITRVYRNDGSGHFADANARLAGQAAGAMAWGDFDNDGDLDLVVSGFYYSQTNGQQCSTKLYRNDGPDRFTPVDVPFAAVHYSSIAWGDYDNDGDLDLAISGVTCDYQPVTRIYRNECLHHNTPPQPPANLNAQTAGETITFNWTAGSDAETPASGLYYQLRVGTSPGADDVYSAMADATTGYRRKPGLSGLRQQLSWRVEGLKNPPYYWSVQSIDTGLAGSVWAGEPSANWSRVENTTKSTWHETIQGAIDGSEDGDVLVLSPGIYTGPGNWELDFSHDLAPGVARNITLRGKDPASSAITYQTVIDCVAQGSRWPHRAFWFHSGETSDSALDGITIRNALAPAGGEIPGDGGAILISDSTPTIRRCVFENCGSPSRGGAIAVINTDSSYREVNLIESTFAGNRANAGGGAVYALGAHLDIRNCKFDGNSAPKGGAIMHEALGIPIISIRNSVFDANFAAQEGGAIHAGLEVRPDIRNCTLTNNMAGAKGALYGEGDNYPFVSNCIFWGNRDSTGSGEDAQLSMQSLNIRYSHVQGWTGTYSGYYVTGEDPGLSDIDGPDDDPVTWMDNQLGLSRTSPCINAGDPGITYVDQMDIDGQDRIQSCRPDVGADETPWSLPRADYNRDCRVDRADLRFFMMCATAAGVRQKDPTCAEVDLDGDEYGDVDAVDFAIFQRCWSGSLEADRYCDQN